MMTMALSQQSTYFAVLCILVIDTTCTAAPTGQCPKWKCDALNDQIEAEASCLRREVDELRNHVAQQTDSFKNELAELRILLGGNRVNETTPVPMTTTSTDSRPAHCGSGTCVENISNRCARRRMNRKEIPGFANYTSRSSDGYMFHCQTTNFQVHEVYGVGLYEREGRSNNNEVELYLRLAEGATAHPVKLLLSHYQPINWKIHADPCVDVREVLMVAYSEDYSSVEVVGAAAQPTVTKIHDYVSYGRIRVSGDRFDYGGYFTNLTQYAVDNFGFLTSFVGTYLASAISINVGLQC